MSHRLAAVTGARNTRIFRPYTEWKVQRVDDEVDIGVEAISGCLQKACVENGYRTLELDSCVFKGVERINVPGFDGAPAPSVEEPQVLAGLDSNERDMTLTEVNV